MNSEVGSMEAGGVDDKEDRCGWMREGGGMQCRLDAGHEGTHCWGELPAWAFADEEDASDNKEGTQAMPDMPSNCKREISPDKWDALRRVATKAKDKGAYRIMVNPSAILELLSELRGMERGGEGLPANTKNIHGELLPEKYRFTEEDEKRLDSLDFYTHRDGVQLPPADITEADRFIAWRWYGQFMVPCTEERLGAVAWRISRERQFRATLSVTEGVDGGWIEIKEDSLITDQMEMGRWMGNKWVITRSEGLRQGWELIQPNDFYTHYRSLNPPPQSGVDGREKS